MLMRDQGNQALSTLSNLIFYYQAQVNLFHLKSILKGTRFVNFNLAMLNAATDTFRIGYLHRPKPGCAKSIRWRHPSRTLTLKLVGGVVLPRSFFRINHLSSLRRNARPNHLLFLPSWLRVYSRWYNFGQFHLRDLIRFRSLLSKFRSFFFPRPLSVAQNPHLFHRSLFRLVHLFPSAPMFMNNLLPLLHPQNFSQPLRNPYTQQY